MFFVVCEDAYLHVYHDRMPSYESVSYHLRNLRESSISWHATYCAGTLYFWKEFVVQDSFGSWTTNSFQKYASIFDRFYAHTRISRDMTLTHWAISTGSNTEFSSLNTHVPYQRTGLWLCCCWSMRRGTYPAAVRWGGQDLDMCWYLSRSWSPGPDDDQLRRIVGSSTDS